MLEQPFVTELRPIVDSIAEGEACRAILLRQLSERCTDKYDGNLAEFIRLFVTPAAELLKKLQDPTEVSSIWRDGSGRGGGGEGGGREEVRP